MGTASYRIHHGTRAAGVRRAQCLDHRAPRAVRRHGSSSAQPSGFGGFGKPQLHEHFNEALDIVDEPVYRSAGTHLSWQPANDDLDFDSDQPVYRSLGGLGSSTGGFAVDEVDVDMPGLHEAWMQSMPPLVQRQSAF